MNKFDPRLYEYVYEELRRGHYSFVECHEISHRRIYEMVGYYHREWCERDSIDFVIDKLFSTARSDWFGSEEYNVGYQSPFQGEPLCAIL